MKLGLQIPFFTWDGGPARLGPRLADIGRAADDAGYDSLWLMDHLFQIGVIGPPELEMLEAYTTLGFLAGHTSRVRLGALVTAVTYRHPGVLVKQVTTLDVLSGGRAILGIGAAWNTEECDGLGIPFPPVGERFERLEETLRIARQMWSGDDGPFQGRHYQLSRTLNSPPALSAPRPPILVGGGGERKTLRLVAKYADACNFFGDVALARRKLAILREHCEAEGTDFDAIEKTLYYPMDVAGGANVDPILDTFAALSDAGIDGVIGPLARVEDLEAIRIVGERIIPQVADL
jgi:F420-dependent oxidoreductase-like protein